MPNEDEVIKGSLSASHRRKRGARGNALMTYFFRSVMLGARPHRVHDNQFPDNDH